MKATAPQMTDLSVGARLRLVRQSAHLSVVEMSRRVGVSRESWTEYEGDKRDFPSRVLARIAEEFNVSADWLLFGASRVKRDGGVARSFRVHAGQGAGVSTGQMPLLVAAKD